MEYHDLYSLEKSEIGQTKMVKHTIVLQNPDTTPFKEWFCRIPPPQVEEVREHLKLMLKVGAIRPSNSPWCNAVVLVRKKDGFLQFCIDFRWEVLMWFDSEAAARVSGAAETVDYFG